MAKPKYLKTKILVAQLSLLWERFYAAYWPSLCVCGAFIASAWLGLFVVAGRSWHISLLLIFTAALLRATISGLRNFSFPNRENAARRLEQDSGLKHRPLRSLHDTQGNRSFAEPATAELWRKHISRLTASLNRLWPGSPKPSIAKRDQRAFRIAIVLLLAISSVVAHNRWLPRLEQALRPGLPYDRSAGLSAAMELWVTPPLYTRLAPAFPLKNPQKTLRIPANSLLEAHVSGGFRKPVAKTNSGSEKFSSAGRNSFVFKKELSHSGSLAIHQGFIALGNWNIKIIPDFPPTVILEEAQTRTNGNLQISLHARDDYGLESLTAGIRLSGQTAGPAPYVFDLSAAQPGTTEIKTTVSENLTDHPWAGKTVIMTVTATDAAGQTGTSEPVELMLPEKTFNNPVAAEISAIRKVLFENGESGMSEAVNRLETILAQTENPINTPIIPLALRAAASRLRYNNSADSITSTASLLWDLALRIEDGNGALAERKFHEALENLMDAMNKDQTTGEDALALAEKMEAALGEYLLEIFKEVYSKTQAGKEMPELPADMADRILRTDELGRFLEHIRHLIKNGRLDEARELLSSLREATNALDLKNIGEITQQQQQAMENLKKLRALIDMQQSLVDETFRLLPQTPVQQQSYGEIILNSDETMPFESWPPQPQEPASETAEKRTVEDARPLAWEQNRIRVELGEITRSLAEILPEIPEQLAQADHNMGLAENKLRLAYPDAALSFEQQALEELQELLKNQTEQMMQQMAGMAGLLPMPEGSFNGGHDPLGRKRNGKGWLDPSSDVKIPDESQSQKAHEILQELRTRANDLQRPKTELDYIDRLLRQF